MTICNDRLLCNLLKQHKAILEQATPNFSNTVFAELNKTFTDSFNNLQSTNLKQITDFILWNDTINKYGIYGQNKRDKRNNFSSKKYSRGRLLFIDYGHHNVGLEFSFCHMGIVIKDFGNLLVVIPVTSDKNQVYSAEIEKSIIRVDVAQYNQFDDNSVLLLHQIQSISKNRIIKDLFKTINHTALMEEIEEKLYSTYCTYHKLKVNNELNRLNQLIQVKEQENLIKDVEIENLKKQFEEVQVKLEQIASSGQV